LVLLTALSHSAAGQPAPAEPYTLSKEDQKLLDQSDEIDRQLEQRGMVYHDAALEEYLAQLAAPMLPKSSPAYVHWRIRILREGVVNAQASPNGSIYVNTGLLAALENEDQLAGVLAHEITHVANRHSFQFLKSFRKKTLAIELLGGGTTRFPNGGFMINSIFANVSQFALVVSVLVYSRELEQEADGSVVPLMKSIGRDAAQYARAFEILEERLDPGPARHADVAVGRRRRIAGRPGRPRVHIGFDVPEHGPTSARAASRPHP
jgi:predicted Zn-dependent protease